MADHVAKRTLVKSPPELWAEVSEERNLAARLRAIGEIRITRLEPETTVAWEGIDVRGTVELAPAGWGTVVTIRAQAGSGAAAEVTPIRPAEDPQPEPEPEPAEPAPGVTPLHPEPEPAQEPEPELPPAAVRRGFFARLFRRRARATPPAATPVPAAPADAQAPQAPADSATPPAAAGTLAEELRRAEAQVDRPAPRPATSPGPARADLDAILAAVLDDLGSAHHRPFSRL